MHFCTTSSKKEQIALAVCFFFHFSYGDEPLLFARKQQKFAVVGIYKSAQTSSANGGSEPSTRYHQLQPNFNSMFVALAESLTRAFRFLEEKCGRSDRKEMRLQVASATCGFMQFIFYVLPLVYFKPRYM